MENIVYPTFVFHFYRGFLVQVPHVGNLHESIRNFFFHVPMWFGQIALLTLSLGYSIAYLRTQNMKHDIYASEFAKTGIVFGILGLAPVLYGQLIHGENPGAMIQNK